MQSLTDRRLDIRLITLDYTEHGPLPDLPREVMKALPAPAWTRLLRGWSPSMARLLDQIAPKTGLIHNHGLWMFPNHYAAATARRHRLPYIISPRGMLGGWALRHNALGKHLLLLLRERRDLATAAAFHATSPTEAEDIRRAGWHQPIAIIPNGVDPAPAPLPPPSALDNLVPRAKGKRVALFLSRLHPKKGAVELVTAWSAQSDAARHGWHLILAGPDLSGHRPAIEAAIRLDRDPASVSLIPCVEGASKHALLHNADIFILPTKEENFGIVIAEALAHGTPVLTTQSAPWKSLETERCGWWIPDDPAALQSTLATILTTPPQDLAERGARGRAHVSATLGWPTIAERMASFYHWILHRGAKPSFVEP